MLKVGKQTWSTNHVINSSNQWPRFPEQWSKQWKYLSELAVEDTTEMDNNMWTKNSMWKRSIKWNVIPWETLKVEPINTNGRKGIDTIKLNPANKIHQAFYFNIDCLEPSPNNNKTA